MGNFSIILALAAILAGGVVAVNLQSTSSATQGAVAEQQFEILAREVSLAGLQTAVRDIARDAIAMGGFGNAAQFARADVPHDGGAYSVQVRNDCSVLTPGAVTATWPVTPGNFIEVVSTGAYESGFGDDAIQSHEIRACYIYLNVSSGTPPSFDFAFFSDQTFTFNGGPDIVSVDIDGEGNVHSNADMRLGPQVRIEGHATYVDPGGTTWKHPFLTQVHSFGEGSPITIDSFDVDVYRDGGAHLYTRTGDSVPPSVGSADVNTADNPFIWFHDGDLEITNHLVLPGYTIIVTTGNLDISGNAAVTAVEDLPNKNWNDTKRREWINRNLTEDGKNKIAFYVNGNASLNGTPTVVGNFYSNGNFTLNGGGKGNNMVGAAQAKGTLTANGGGNGNNFWYTGASEAVVYPGLSDDFNEIRLVAVAEWTDSVLDNTTL